MASKRKESVKTDPTKEFFVYMITKDIGLEECVIDLMDNSADGARRMLMSNGHSDADLELDYTGFSVDVTFDSNKFVIEDNCGGITIGLAREYAFRFGRRPDTPDITSYGIGIFGIGMKRAIFKMGQKILVESSTASEAFSLDIDVNKWIGKPDKWDFELEHADKWDKPGTRITVEQLFPGISSEYGDSNFETELIKQIGRAYSIFIRKGFSVYVNGNSVRPFIPEFLSSDEFQAADDSYQDERTKVRIVAGSTESPPDDSSAETTQERSVRIKAEKFGWYVACNDRIMVAADKTGGTVWGDDNFAVWHPQYNGFIGLVISLAKIGQRDGPKRNTATLPL